MNKHIKEQMEYYRVGSIIYCGYWQVYDKVLDFEVIGDRWEVQVARCTKSGEIVDSPRWHSTAFDRKRDKIIELFIG